MIKKILLYSTFIIETFITTLIIINSIHVYFFQGTKITNLILFSSPFQIILLCLNSIILLYLIKTTQNKLSAEQLLEIEHHKQFTSQLEKLYEEAKKE